VATHKTAVELLKKRLGEDGLAALLRMVPSSLASFLQQYLLSLAN
jgi:hypothetical protein